VTAPAALLSLALLAFDWFPRGLAAVDTGGGATSAKTCASCHAGAHAEWARSRHGLAWTNAIFQREYKDKPQDWCVHCHAPLAQQLAEVHRGGGALANEGVTCVACHVRGGRMLARTRGVDSPHDTDARPDFGGPAYCGGCHQFNFPVVEPATDGGGPRVVRYTDRPMQDTQHQHATGPRASLECQTCHRTKNATGHLFPGGHDEAMVRSALTVSSCRAGPALEITLANTGAGHNVPTGDLHRHLVLRTWRADAPERLAEFLFGRRFEPDAEGGKRTVADTTIPAGASRVVRVPVADLGGDARVPVRLELRLVYTIDEFPFRGRELAAPTYVTMFEDERALTALPACAGGGAATSSRSRAPRR
jgi:Cytochrome c554 and c-prime